MGVDQGHSHVGLLASGSTQGPAIESVPARRNADEQWLLLASPALALGCAQGDIITVDADGHFHVVTRGGNVVVLSYADIGDDLHSDGEALSELFSHLSGIVEVHPSGRALVATISAKQGFPVIEAALAQWNDRTGRTWYYGNVYDEQDRPLNWWP